jgi:hypothetical protein
MIFIYFIVFQQLSCDLCQTALRGPFVTSAISCLPQTSVSALGAYAVVSLGSLGTISGLLLFYFLHVISWLSMLTGMLVHDSGLST